MSSLMKLRIIDYELCVCEYGLQQKNRFRPPSPPPPSASHGNTVWRWHCPPSSVIGLSQHCDKRAQFSAMLLGKLPTLFYLQVLCCKKVFFPINYVFLTFRLSSEVWSRCSNMLEQKRPEKSYDYRNLLWIRAEFIHYNTIFGTDHMRPAYSVLVYMKSVSWCRRRRAHNWNGELLGAGKGNGEGEGRGRSVYKQPGTRVDRDLTTHKGGIPSKWEGQGNRRGFARQRGNYQGELSRGRIKRVVPCALILSILYIHIMLLCVCG